MVLCACGLASRVSITAVHAVCIVLSADEVGDCLAVLGSVRRQTIRTYAAVVEGSLETVNESLSTG
jgi:hypothetical protein